METYMKGNCKSRIINLFIIYSKNNSINGNGTMIWIETHEKYTGHWENNLQNGYGVHTWFEKSSNFRGLRNRYVGEWKNGVRNGYGVFFYSDGSKYEGYWENNEKCGFGVFYFKNGSEYIGQFQNDRMMDYNTEGIVAIRTKEGEEKEDTTQGKKTTVLTSTSVRKESGLELPKITKPPIIEAKSSKLEVIIESNNETPMKGVSSPTKKGENKKVEPFLKFNKKPSQSKPVINKKEEKPIKRESLKERKDNLILKKDIKGSEKNIFANDKNSLYLASARAIMGNNLNQFRSLIDLSDIVETEGKFEETEKDIENVLQRNITEIRKWYYKLLNCDTNDVENFFNSRAGTLLTNPNFEDEIQINPQSPNSDNVNSLLQDDKIGLCLELKDLWKFFRDYGIISKELTIAQLNRNFYKNPKNLTEMFLIPEDLPKNEKYKKIYGMIEKSAKIFNKKHDIYSKQNLKRPKQSGGAGNEYDLYYCEDEIDIKDYAFNFHYHHHVIVLRQFYEAIVRAAYLKYLNLDSPLYKKVELLISKCKTKNQKERIGKSHNSKSNLFTSGIMHELSQQLINPISNEQKQKNAEHQFIETFIDKFECLLKPIFNKLYYSQQEKKCSEENENDITLTHRFIFNGLIMKSEIMKKYYGTKELYSELITYYHKEKKIGFSSKKEQFEYYETLFDLEIIFYEFCELVFLISKKYFLDNCINEEDDSKYDTIIEHLWEIIKSNEDFNTVKQIKCAKYTYSYPINQTHILIQQNIDDKLEKEHIKLLKRYEKLRYENERKQMDIEKETNAYVPDFIPQGDDADFLSEESDD